MSWFSKKSPKQAALTATEEMEGASTKGTYGLEVCHDNPNAVADIIFVHGLTGNRKNTWTHKGNDKIFWPGDLLPQELPSVRVMTYGYDADIAHFWAMASQNRIGEHAGNLVNAIARERIGSERRPIIFVTHSLGGLVTEDALLFSKNSADSHLQDVFWSVVGICFLGTPHCGSDLARWGSIMGSLASVIKKANVDLLNVLKTDSEVLARVQREFHTMLRGPMFERRPALNITCFWEELPVRGVGEIVPKHSAILPQYNAIGIRDNHMDMTKFSGLDDEGYKAVAAELRRWTKAISRKQTGTHGNAQESQQANTYRDYMGRPPPPGSNVWNEDYQSHMNHAQTFTPPMGNLRSEPQPRFSHPGSGYSEYQRPGGYGSTPYAPTQRCQQYQQYRSEGGYVSPPPPPEPRLLEAVPPQPSRSPYYEQPEQSAYQCPQWDRRPSPRPDAAWNQPSPEPRWEDRRPSPPPSKPSYHQSGNHTISGTTMTYEGGKTLQGMNVQVGGDFSM